MRLHVVSRCAVQPDPGYGRSKVDACWQTPDAGFVGVVCGFSPEPTLLRSDLAERTANLTCAAMLDEWMREPTSGVEARLRGVFEAVNQRVRDEARSVVEWPRTPPRRRWPWRRIEASPPGQTVFHAHAHVAALAVDGDAIYVAHVGSCRVFARREGAWSQLTRDHTLADQYAAHEDISVGSTAAELPIEYHSICTRALGLDDTASRPTIARYSINDAPFLVCTESVGFPLFMDRSAANWGDPESMLARFENLPGALVIVARSGVTA